MSSIVWWVDMLIFLLCAMLCLPTLAIIGSLLIQRPRVSEWLNLIASLLTLLVVLPLPYLSLSGPYYLYHGFFIFDAMAAWVLLCVGVVYSLASIYAIGYMRAHQKDEGLHLFYALLAGFALTMLLAPIMNNIAVYWISIELTTLISTFLVSFVKTRESIEAAWKYIIIVCAGISLALLGIIFFYWGGTFLLGPTYDLTWAVLASIAPHMQTSLLGLSFLLVLVGFGTKVGLAPMHTWLPDAHSEGPAPVSAMLSGALLNAAMLGIVRFLSIMQHTSLAAMANLATIALGVLSLLVAGLFILKQKDIKRLMAYSSVEHMGVLALGFGFGGPLGYAGALYHMLSHSLNKSLMFFGAGNAMIVYHTKTIDQIRGVLQKMPLTGSLWLMGAIAITGSPPFALFISEVTILRAGMQAEHTWAVVLMAVLLILIFCGFVHHFWHMYFSQATGHATAASIETPHRLSLWCKVPMCLAMVPLLILGVWWPQSFWHYFMQIFSQLGGV